MRVVVLGRNGAGSRYHYITGYHGPVYIWFDIVPMGNKEKDIQPDTPGTMVPCNIIIARTRSITPQDHYTHASIA